MEEEPGSPSADAPIDTTALMMEAVARRRCPKCREKELRMRADRTVWCGNCGEELGNAGLLISSGDVGGNSDVPRWAMVLAGSLIGLLGGYCVRFFIDIDPAISVPLGGTLGALVGAFTTLPSES